MEKETNCLSYADVLCDVCLSKILGKSLVRTRAGE